MLANAGNVSFAATLSSVTKSLVPAWWVSPVMDRRAFAHGAREQVELKRSLLVVVAPLRHSAAEEHAPLARAPDESMGPEHLLLQQRD